MGAASLHAKGGRPSVPAPWTSGARPANNSLNLAVVEEFICRTGSSFCDIVIDFLQEEIEGAGSRVCFKLPVPFTIAQRIEPLPELGDLTRGKLGDGLFYFGNVAHALNNNKGRAD